MSISVVIPAYNEQDCIGQVIRDSLQNASEILVIDDGSLDRTCQIAADEGARVIHLTHGGYISVIKRGFQEASGDIIVTLNAYGEFNPGDIPRLIQPIIDGEADLVLGSRKLVPRLSERFINWISKWRISVTDSGTGFRAIRSELAKKLELNGLCICVISVLEPYMLGDTIVEVPIAINVVDKPRRIAWHHIPQILITLRWLIMKQRILIP